jgi:uncharacterized protein YndB with AHSA1/START domain
MKKDLVLKKERQINASPSKVWEVLTSNQWIEQWLGVQMITDWQPGSAIAFKFEYKDKEIIDKGTVVHFEPEKKFSYTYWSVFSTTEDVPENYSVITFDLIAGKNATVLTLTQTNFATKLMYTHSDKNWEDTLDTIKKLAEEGMPMANWQ